MFEDDEVKFRWFDWMVIFFMADFMSVTVLAILFGANTFWQGFIGGMILWALWNIWNVYEKFRIVYEIKQEEENR